MACCEIPELDGMIIYRWGSNRKIIHKWSLRGKSSMNGILSGKSSTKRYHWTIGLGIFQQAMFDCHRVNIHQNDPYWLVNHGTYSSTIDHVFSWHVSPWKRFVQFCGSGGNISSQVAIVLVEGTKGEEILGDMWRYADHIIMAAAEKERSETVSRKWHRDVNVPLVILRVPKFLHLQSK